MRSSDATTRHFRSSTSAPLRRYLHPLLGTGTVRASQDNSSTLTVTTCAVPRISAEPGQARPPRSQVVPAWTPSQITMAIRSVLPIAARDVAYRHTGRVPHRTRRPGCSPHRPALRHHIRSETGAPYTVASSDPVSTQLDELQYAGGVGPAAGAVQLAIRFAGQNDLIGHLRTARNSRSTTDQAIGILMAATL